MALLDIDEVIMPLKHTNWADMMEDAVKASLKVRETADKDGSIRDKDRSIRDKDPICQLLCFY